MHDNVHGLYTIVRKPLKKAGKINKMQKCITCIFAYMVKSVSYVIFAQFSGYCRLVCF